MTLNASGSHRAGDRGRAGRDVRGVIFGHVWQSPSPSDREVASVGATLPVRHRSSEPEVRLDSLHDDVDYDIEHTINHLVLERSSNTIGDDRRIVGRRSVLGRA